MSAKMVARSGSAAVAYHFIVVPDGHTQPESDTEIRCRWCYVIFKDVHAFDWHECDD